MEVPLLNVFNNLNYKMINSQQLIIIGVCTIAFGSIVQLVYDVYFVLWIGIFIIIYSRYLDYTKNKL